MTTTSNLGITFVETSMAAKETAINEGFQRIDALSNTGAISRVLTTPPASPANGDLYIVPASATGAWSGQTNKMAFYHSNWGWVFIPPREGMQLWVNNEDTVYLYNGSSWASSGFALPYATGSFTPTLYGATTAGTTTYGVREGQYTRIGNMVFAHIGLSWSNLTGTGEARISGLPFTSASGAVNRSGIVVSYYNDLALPSGKNLGGMVDGGSNIVRLSNLDHTTVVDFTDMAEVTINGDLYFSVTYRI